MPKKIKTVSDFQRKTKPTFDEIKKSKTPVLIMNRKTPVGVIMSMRLYDEMIEEFEDLIDSIAADKAMKNTKDEDFITLDQFNKMIK